MYYLDDITNIESFDPNNIEKYEKSYKNILTYYIGHITIKYSKFIKRCKSSVPYFQQSEGILWKN